MSSIAFHVHDGINAHGMRIRTSTRAYNHDLAADMLADKLVGLGHRHHV